MKLVINTPDGEYEFSPLEKAEEEVELEASGMNFHNGIYLEVLEGAQCREFVLASADIPEFKEEMRTHCRKGPFGVKVCLDLPTCFRRTAKVKLIAKVCAPTSVEEAAWNVIRDCALGALGVGAATAIANPAAALPAMKASFIACLAATSWKDLADQLELGLFTRQKSTSWKHC